MRLLLFLLLFSICFINAKGQTNSWVTEYYLSQHFTPKSGITPGANNTLWMSCDQVLARYQVAISGTTTTGNRWPSQNQLTSACTRPGGLTTDSLFYSFGDPAVPGHIFTDASSIKRSVYYFSETGIGYYVGKTMQRSGLVGVGATLWDGTGTDCNKITDGYYLYATGGYGTFKNRIIQVVSGVITSSVPALENGDQVGGGIIAYVVEGSSSNYDGIIISNTDLSTGATWGCQGATVTTSTNALQGTVNTTNIINVCGDPTIAAKLCEQYSNDGFDDWYLPSATDLSRVVYTSYFANLTNYWTSSQASATNAYYYYRNGTGYGFSSIAKSTAYRVRAIRYF